MNKKIVKPLIFILILFILIIPVISSAQGLVPCTNIGKDICNFDKFMIMINTVIKFILFNMAIPIAAIMFAYAGFLLVTAGGEAAGARTKAKNIFTNALIGLVLAVAAWLIITTILSILGYKDTPTYFSDIKPSP